MEVTYGLPRPAGARQQHCWTRNESPSEKNLGTPAGRPPGSEQSRPRSDSADARHGSMRARAAEALADMHRGTHGGSERGR